MSGVPEAKHQLNYNDLVTVMGMLSDVHHDWGLVETQFDVYYRNEDVARGHSCHEVFGVNEYMGAVAKRFSL